MERIFNLVRPASFLKCPGSGTPMLSSFVARDFCTRIQMRFYLINGCQDTVQWTQLNIMQFQFPTCMCCWAAASIVAISIGADGLGLIACNICWLQSEKLGSTQSNYLIASCLLGFLDWDRGEWWARRAFLVTTLTAIAIVMGSPGWHSWWLKWKG